MATLGEFVGGIVLVGDTAGKTIMGVYVADFPEDKRGNKDVLIIGETGTPYRCKEHPWPIRGTLEPETMAFIERIRQQLNLELE